MAGQPAPGTQGAVPPAARTTAPPSGGDASQLEGMPGMVAEVYSPRCDGCGVCVDECPVGAIAVSVLATIDTFACTGCGRCVAACPTQAITLRKP